MHATPKTAPHDALAALRQRAEREINEGLLPAAQFAVAQSGQLVAFSRWAIALMTHCFPYFHAPKRSPPRWLGWR